MKGVSSPLFPEGRGLPAERQGMGPAGQGVRTITPRTRRVSPGESTDPVGAPLRVNLNGPGRRSKSFELRTPANMSPSTGREYPSPGSRALSQIWPSTGSGAAHRDESGQPSGIQGGGSGTGFEGGRLSAAFRSRALSAYALRWMSSNGGTKPRHEEQRKGPGGDGPRS